MNIFFLNQNPSLAAKDLCNVHVVKMITESLQMLTTATIRHGVKESQLPLTKKGTHVKKTHEKHPSTVWAGNTRSNYDWLCEHAMTMCQEYTKAYKKTHFCEKGIYTLSSLNYLVPDGPLQEFAVAISDHMNCRKLPDFNIMSVVDKYRAYYILDKKDISKWTHGRQKPEWINSYPL